MSPEQQIFRSAQYLVVTVLLAASSLALAQSSGGAFEITHSTIDNGGGRSSGGQFTLTGTIGQADASLQSANGGQFQLTGGFWANDVITPPPDELIFSDGFENH